MWYRLGRYKTWPHPLIGADMYRTGNGLWNCEIAEEQTITTYFCPSNSRQEEEYRADLGMIFSSGLELIVCSALYRSRNAWDQPHIDAFLVHKPSTFESPLFRRICQLKIVMSEDTGNKL